VDALNIAGEEEPYIVAGTVLSSNPQFGTFEHNQSSLYPYNTAWMNISYEYGPGDSMALGLFIAGNAQKLPRAKAEAMNSEFVDGNNL
jgi:hypothetical protein